MTPACVVIDGRDYYDCDGRLIPAIAGGYGTETLIYIAIAAAVASAAVGTYAAYQQGQQTQAAGKYNAKVAQNQAQQAQQAAAIRADILRQRASSIESSNIARAASGGILPTEGSPLFVMADNAQAAELEAQRAIYAGEVNATGYQSQRELSLFNASNAAEAGNLRAGQTLLSGVSSSASAYRPRIGGSVNPQLVQAD